MRSDPRSDVIAAAHRLVAERGRGFTIHELVREADVALQTFYRYFGGKDQLLVELIGDQIREQCTRLRSAASAESDPVERLRFHIRTTLSPLGTEAERSRARFIATEHWRLHQLLPVQLAEAVQPFATLIESELDAGATAGVLRPSDPKLDSWLVTRTVMSVFHHYVFLPDDPAAAGIGDAVADFCVAAVGGEPAVARAWANGGPR